MINDHFWGMISTASEVQSAASRKRVFADTINIRSLTNQCAGSMSVIANESGLWACVVEKAVNANQFFFYEIVFHCWRFV